MALLLLGALLAGGCSTSKERRRIDSHPQSEGGPDAAPDDGGGAGGTPADSSVDSNGGASSGGSGAGGNGGALNATGGGANPDAGTVRATLSGHLRVSDFLFVDGDTASIRQPLVPNDTMAEAQALLTPSLAGGYLGITRGLPDPRDVYRIALGASEGATLHIAARSDGSALPDFDLVLLNESGTIVDDSLGTGPTETVRAPTSGTYYLIVEAPFNEPGLYTLSIGPSMGGLKTSASLDSAWSHARGEALVKLRPTTQATSNMWARLGVLPIGHAANAVGYSRVALTSSSMQTSRTTPGREEVRQTLQGVKRLRRAPEVEWAEPNYVRVAHAPPPDDPLFPSQWHYQQVSLLSAWDHTRGAGTIVAVLDTGVKKIHPDFVNADSSGQLLAGYDMISEPFIADDGDGLDSDSDDPGDRSTPNDSSWHGSHVAGTVAAATDNGVGCAGIAPQAKILPVRVLGVGGGLTYDIMQGILYAAGLANDAGVTPTVRADVINMSLGGPGLSRATADAIAAARAAGTVVVASAGNDSRNVGIYSPAAEPGVVTVGAVDATKGLAWYSNFGNGIDVVAPGGDESIDTTGDGLTDGVLSLVYSSRGARLYASYEGTSMASPHVAGIIALMRAAFPGLTPSDVDDMLTGTRGVGPIVSDLGTVGKDTLFGNGLINANQAVLAALEAANASAPDVPVLLVSATALDFGTTLDELPLEISNAGRGTLTVTSVTADAAWVSVTPGASGTNTVTVNRPGLADGVHVATITVQTNGGTATVDVRVLVNSGAVAGGGNVGAVFVLAVDPRTNVVVAQARATSADGYAFRISGLPVGAYRLLAGTDLDESGIIDDEGEAFGAYPVTSAPGLIFLSADTADLDFPVRFQFGVTQEATRSGIRKAPY